MRVLQDLFFHRAKAQGYLARAAYKLLEIQERYKVVPEGGRVLVLGCAPGGWLQVACQLLGPLPRGGVVLGLDIQECPVPRRHCDARVATLQADTRPETPVGKKAHTRGAAAEPALATRAVELRSVSSGAADTEAAGDAGAWQGVLRPGGSLVIKVLEGDHRAWGRRTAHRAPARGAGVRRTMDALTLVVSALLLCGASVHASTITLTPGLPVVFTLYFNNDDSGTNAGQGTSRISMVGAGGTPEGTTSRRKLLQRTRFTSNLVFNHDLFDCTIVSGCSVQTHSATSNTYACSQQVSPFCQTIFAIAANGTAPGLAAPQPPLRRRRALLQTNLEKFLKVFVACKRAVTKQRINCVFEVPQTQTNYNLLTLFQYPIAPTTYVDCELSLGNAVAHSGACFVPFGAPTRFNMHFDGPAEVLPAIQFSVQLNQNPPTDPTDPDSNADQYAFFLNTNPTLLVDSTGIIKISGNAD
ncbi:hypothetical protein WJX81_002824 [Elliptochloris bilobata]|uniref:rRNA methyltransferase 2, mitochondrial n=1 Tax=Elliptochloris bilobata TaxID=381761 RepID=A0AAW1SI20_9CHLO